MKVLLFSPAPRAGTVQYSHNLANALAERGHVVALVTGVGFELGSYPRRYTAMEVIDRFRPRPLRLLRLVRYLRSFRPDVIHLQGAQHPVSYLGLWAMLRVLTRAVVVYTPQDVLPNKVRGYHRSALGLLYRRVSHVFLNNRHNEQVITGLFGVSESKITVLPMADLTAFVRDGSPPVLPEIAPERRVVLCFGLIEPRKGIGTLLEAFPRVLTRLPQAYLSVVGKALMDVEPYFAEIDRLGMKDSVDLIPDYVSFAEMCGYFRRAEVVVLPYESGWNSGVLASAYGFEKPVVATSVGGFDEYVNDEVDGLLVPPREPGALADAIIRVLSDENLRGRLHEGLRSASARYSWAEIARRTDEVYATVVGTR